MQSTAENYIPYPKIVWPGSTQLAPLPVVLVGCGDGGEATPFNLLTVAWTGIVCSDPAMVAIAVRPERFSFPLIVQSGEFTVNVPTAAMAKAVDYCGVVSGRAENKFAHCQLTPVRGGKVAAPLVLECPLGLECKVKQTIALGVHTLFLAEIVAVQAAEALLDENGKFRLDQAGLLTYVHGHYHAVGRELGHFGYSIRKKPATKRPKSKFKTKPAAATAASRPRREAPPR